MKEPDVPSYLDQRIVRTPVAAPFNEGVINVPSSAPSIDIPALIRKYIALAVLMGMLGIIGGGVAVVVVSPVYKARTLLEVQPLGSGLLKLGAGDSGDGQVNIQTEAAIVLSNAFLKNVLERLQLQSTPPAPERNDLFSSLRRKWKIGAYNDIPVSVTREGLESERVSPALAMAVKTLDAHPVERTRILEITCESTNPELASNFLNSLAEEYKQNNYQKRMASIQVATQWLAQKQDETKSKMLEAEQRLQEFVRNSGNVFITHDQEKENTLADFQLQELRSRLSAAEADLIPKQTRYEMVQKSSPEALPDVLSDGSIHEFQTKIADLRAREAQLTTTLTPANSKVKMVEAEIGELQASLKKATESAKQRIINDYDAARQNRDLLSKAYASQASRVTAQGGKEAEYNALKREADSARQTYNTMLQQANQADISNSIPITNINVVDPSVPAQTPYKPKPTVLLGMGAAVGLAMCGGIVFLLEGLNRRVTSPGHARHLFNLPQLGVIPTVTVSRERPTVLSKLTGISDPSERAILSLSPGNPSLEDNSAKQNAFLTESFRNTLASLLRESTGLNRPQVILVTSPNPEEGKTTIACNLGIALAETERRVVIIDADFRRPRIHRMFGLSNDRGLADLLVDSDFVAHRGDETPEIKTSIPNLYILPNGRPVENLAKVLYSPRLRELIERLRKQFDTIILDAPPALHLADARIMSAAADGVVLVIRSGVTDKSSALEVLDYFRADGTVVLGTILNDWKPVRSKAMRDYYLRASTRLERP